MTGLRPFLGSLVATLVTLAVVGVLTGSPSTVATVAVLAVLEVTLSFDNAVVNAKYLRKMSPLWQRLFLTVGVLIAVFGMRLVFPILIVAVTAHLFVADVVGLALNDPDAYAASLDAAKSAIYAFGGTFLLMIFLDWVIERRPIMWLRPVESGLSRLGAVNELPVMTAAVSILLAALAVEPAETQTVLFSGLAGLLTYLAVAGLDAVFGADDPTAEAAAEEPGAAEPRRRGGGVVAASFGTAGFTTFLYLEVLDASFSFDGVIGAFAISTNVLVIAAGLGIGAMFVRSLTLYLVRQGTLAQYRYLEHGAHWAIAALAVVLLAELRYSVPAGVSGMLGLGLILAAYTSSVLANRSDERTPQSTVARSPARIRAHTAESPPTPASRPRGPDRAGPAGAPTAAGSPTSDRRGPPSTPAS